MYTNLYTKKVCYKANTLGLMSLAEGMATQCYTNINDIEESVFQVSAVPIRKWFNYTRKPSTDENWEVANWYFVNLNFTWGSLFSLTCNFLKFLETWQFIFSRSYFKSNVRTYLWNFLGAFLKFMTRFVVLM